VKYLQQQKTLETTLTRFSFFNLFMVASVGLLLRSFSFFSSFPLEYKNILHGHSHFAFGGWIMPALLVVIMNAYPEVTSKVAYKHWRNISFLMLFSAYGMLASFPEQGYKAVSISFSTLSIASGYYWAIVTWKALKQIETNASHRFLNWALIYMVFSSIGPFATAPLIAIGKQGQPIYFDAIYFYLHFQYNGVFTLMIIGLLYKLIEKTSPLNNANKVATLLSCACIPTYFLSVLWHKPGIIFNIIGGTGAVLQVIALYYLIQDSYKLKLKRNWVSLLISISLACFATKIILQLLSALPYIAHLASEYRNFVIAYLHLVLLGFISTFIFASVIKTVKLSYVLKTGLVLFLFAFVTTEILLVTSAITSVTNRQLPYYIQALFVFTIFFPLSILLLVISLRQRRTVVATNIQVAEMSAM
jgi:hypothetical protein